MAEEQEGSVRPTMPSIFLGAWFKGATGLEADAFGHGVAPSTRDDYSDTVRLAQICLPDEVRYLIQFLHENYPEAWKQYQTALTFARVAGRASPENEWPNITRILASHSGGPSHVVECKNDRWTCTCKGFGYRRKCWAIAFVQKTILAERYRHEEEREATQGRKEEK